MERYVNHCEDIYDELNGIGAPTKFFSVPDEARKPGIAGNLPVKQHQYEDSALHPEYTTHFPGMGWRERNPG
jgi:hypothetical protein